MANALLKTLEEPNAKTPYSSSLTSRPETLLPTIRSRTQRVRFGALPDDVVAKLLEGQGIDTARAKTAARLAGGSVAAAIAQADDEQSKSRDAFVSRALAALDSADLTGALDLAEEAKKAQGGGARAREQLAAGIGALARALADRATEMADRGDAGAERAAARYAVCAMSIEELEGNASPQLVLEAMAMKMRAL